MLIICPKCEKKNDLNLGREVHCGHCKETISDHTYSKVKKTVARTAVVFALGMITHDVVSDTEAEHRYSIENEYAIINMCISSSQRPMSSSRYTEKQDDCICALGKTQKSHTIKELNKNTENYLAAFEAAAKQCKSERTSMSSSR